jgi:hypothetical protein
MCVTHHKSGGDLGTNSKDISRPSVDPDALPHTPATPVLHARTNNENCPGEPYHTPQRRVLEPQPFAQIDGVIFYHDDRSLPNEANERPVVLKRAMNKHRGATMYNCRNAKTRKKLHIFRRKRASTETQYISHEKSAWRRANPSALLMPHRPIHH